MPPARNGPAVFTWLSDSQPAALRPRGRRQNGASRSPLAVVPRAHEAARHRDRPTGEWHARAHIIYLPVLVQNHVLLLVRGRGRVCVRHSSQLHARRRTEYSVFSLRPSTCTFPPREEREANGRPMAPAMLALPDGVYFPTSAGIEMCIDAYMNQVGQRQRA